MRTTIIVFSMFFLQNYMVYPQNNIWEKINSPSADEISCMTVSDNGTLFIADDRSGIYKSGDDGITWSRIFDSGIYSILYRDLAVGKDNNLYVAGRNHLLVMDQSGNPVYYKYFNTDVYSVALNSQLHLYVATKDSGISRTTNFGQSWETNILFPDSNYHFYSLAIDGADNIFIGSNYGAFKSTDDGNSWTSQNSGLTDLYVFNILCSSNEYIYLVGNYGIFRSTNQGEIWEQVNNGIPSNMWTRKIKEDRDSNLYFGSYFGTVFKSSNWGDNWDPIYLINPGTIKSVLLGSDFLLLGCGNEAGFFRAILEDSSLTSISIKPISILHFSQNNLGKYYAICDDYNLRMSSDYGKSWKIIGTGFTGIWMEEDSLLFLGTSSAKVGVLNDSNIIRYWNLGSAACPYRINSILYEKDSNLVFVATETVFNCGGGIYKGPLDINVTTWEKITNDLPGAIDVTSIAINSNKQIFAGVFSKGIYCSNDLGLTWSLSNIGLTDLFVRIIKTDDEDNIYAATYSKIFRSKDHGINWTQIANYYVTGFEIDFNNNLFISVSNQVFKSTNHGLSWTEFGESLPPNFSINGTFLSDSSYLFVYTGNGVYKTKDAITSIKEIHRYSLNNFSLSQNYPNPFNPSTVISYQLPVSGLVTLKVYDVLGNEVATLVSENREAGIYETEFNAEKLSSGVYYYQLRAGEFVETKKMIYLK